VFAADAQPPEPTRAELDTMAARFVPVESGRQFRSCPRTSDSPCASWWTAARLLDPLFMRQVSPIGTSTLLLLLGDASPLGASRLALLHDQQGTVVVT